MASKFFVIVGVLSLSCKIRRKKKFLKRFGADFLYALKLY